jgi:hypothetical protein
MPTVSLLIRDPKLTYTNDEFNPGSWRLSFRADLANGYRQHVDLTSDERTMADLDGTVAFEPDTTEAYMGFEKGSLTYWKGSSDDIHPNPPNYLATLRMPQDDLTSLMKTIADGLPLMSVNISVDDMEYGWEPDGSGKKWDNATKPKIEITGYRLFFGQRDEDDEVHQAVEPVDQTPERVLSAIRDVGSRVSYLLYAIALLIVIALIKLF